MIAISYLMKIKIKKIYFEVIFNTKIFLNKYFQLNCQRPRFCQAYRGTGQRQIQYRGLAVSFECWIDEFGYFRFWGF